ncbi:nucleotidyltransferase domain-containing protein [Candidatus Woesearchaeota archaeon]|nr:nucleotidyltransferase domain-containing protein [Candidatus Woesearchaeota archaeon]
MNYKLISYAQDFASFLLQNLGSDMQKVKQIILFGSVARGEADKDSDIDIFVDLLDEKLEPKIGKIREMFCDSIKVKKYWELLDVKNEINCTVGKLEEWDELKRSLIANGIVLFGKYIYEGRLKTKHYYLFVVTPTGKRNKDISVWRKLYGYVQKIGNKNFVKKGIINEYGGRKLSRGVFVVPVESSQKIISFLRENKFKHEIIPFWQETK